MSIAVMKQALEALEHEANRGNDNAYQCERDALRTAIEQAKEPVAWMYTSHWKGNERYITRYQTDLTTYKADKVWPLYTAPCQWVGLTDEEIVGMTCECVDDGTFNMDCARDFARAIEAKLKGLNT